MNSKVCKSALPRRLSLGWCAALVMGGACLAEDGSLTLSAGMDYSSGKYGGSTGTEIYYVPAILKYERGSSSLKLTLPWLTVKAPTGGTIIDIGPDGRPIYSGTGPQATVRGMGDVVLAYGHGVIVQAWHGLLLDVGAKIKFATADEDKGLGTGKNDYSLYSDLYYHTGGAMTPFMTLGYRVTGDPAGIDLRDVWYASLGLGYKHSHRDSTGLIADARRASRAGRDSPLELTAYWVHKLDSGFKLQSYAVAGLSDASPDYGLGVVASIVY